MRDPFLFDVNGTPKTVFGNSNNLIGTYATRFLRSFEHDDVAPWFLYVAPIDPHWPWTPPPKYANVTFPSGTATRRYSRGIALTNRISSGSVAGADSGALGSCGPVSCGS